MKDLPPNVYKQSYLLKAGVRFNPNLVDTCVKRGLNLSFYVVSAVLISCISLYLALDGRVYISLPTFFCLTITSFLYVTAYLVKLFCFTHIRKRLRIDNPPIAVEAYAVVLFDMVGGNQDKLLETPKRCAVLYKECGSKKPRFFTGPVKHKKHCKLHKDLMALVFIDRKNEKLYTVEDDKLYKTASEKKKKKESSLSSVEAGVQKVSE